MRQGRGGGGQGGGMGRGQGSGQSGGRGQGGGQGSGTGQGGGQGMGRGRGMGGGQSDVPETGGNTPVSNRGMPLPVLWNNGSAPEGDALRADAVPEVRDIHGKEVELKW